MKRCLCTLIACLLLGTGCAPTPEEPIRLVEATAVPSAAPTATAPPTATPSPEPTPEPSPTPMSEEAKLRAYIATLTVEEKIGQLCMFGFKGTDSVSSTFRELMQTYRIGNVILYGQNIVRDDADGGFSRCKRLTDSVQAANPNEFPILISIDVEGGSVTRFDWDKTLYSAKTLGSDGDPDRAYEQFAHIGQRLTEAGIRIDLAPVLDVSKSDTFLKKRIISSDADTAALIGTACIDGLHEGGCLAFCKHFPGHGAINVDSHDAVPMTDLSLERWRSYHLVPFAAAVEAGVDGVLVGHLKFTEIDPDNIASLSYRFLTELLREELGFTGVVMSDDFRMAGLRSSASLETAAVQFLLAGGDLILCGANHDYQRAILNGLTEAVRNGTLPMERLDESVYRILSMKLTAYDMELPYAPDALS